MLTVYLQLFAIFGAAGLYIAGMVLAAVILVVGLFVWGALHDLCHLVRWALRPRRGPR